MLKSFKVFSLLFCAVSVVFSQSWVDISTAKVSTLGTQPWPEGCSGVCVNRLTGDVILNIIGFGLWKSADKGASWTRIDNNTVSGRCESGTALQVDQDDPRHIAIFSLDGKAGYTSDGTTWHSMADMGRNWDFGSAYWPASGTPTFIVCKHEDGGKVFKSGDGGQTWVQMNITVNAQGNNTSSMVGALGPSTFIYCASNGINRSTDGGATWSQVSATSARAKMPVMFKGKVYQGTGTGLLVSSNNGATWQTQGSSVEILQGPFFGADENTMVVVGMQGIFKTTNAGTNWTKITALRPNVNSFYTFDPKWFGGYTWDPVKNVIYATAMANPAYKFEIGASGINTNAMKSVVHSKRENIHILFSISSGTNRSPWLIMNGLHHADLYDFKGRLLDAAEPGNQAAQQAVIKRME